MGIEPTSEAWEASILPLYDARSGGDSAIIPKSALARTDRDDDLPRQSFGLRATKSLLQLDAVWRYLKHVPTRYASATMPPREERRRINPRIGAHS
jgi:hypothetical protein